MLSNLSNKPPCPGIILPKSFTSYCRLINDANKSPKTAKTEAINRTTASKSQLNFNSGVINLNIKHITKPEHKDVASPPATPSFVLCGLISEQFNLCFPKAFPIKYPPVSVIHALDATNKIANKHKL